MGNAKTWNLEIIWNPESGIIEIENDDRKKLTSALSNK